MPISCESAERSPMPNVFDYLEWRGDLTFEETPVNDVDNLIFCLLSYVDLDGIVPTDPAKGHVPLRHAAAEYFFTHGDDRPLGLIVPTDILTLFRRMAHTRRFRDLELTGYTLSFDIENFYTAPGKNFTYRIDIKNF